MSATLTAHTTLRNFTYNVTYFLTYYVIAEFLNLIVNSAKRKLVKFHAIMSRSVLSSARPAHAIDPLLQSDEVMASSILQYRIIHRQVQLVYE